MIMLFFIQQHMPPALFRILQHYVQGCAPNIKAKYNQPATAKVALIGAGCTLCDSMSSNTALPADLFHLLALELAARADFSTLYRCIVSSRYLANAGAVTALYRFVYVP
jgi:hypothetical protein